MRPCQALVTARSCLSPPCTGTPRTRPLTPSRSPTPRELAPGTPGHLLVLVGLLTGKTLRNRRRSKLKSIPQGVSPPQPRWRGPCLPRRRPAPCQPEACPGGTALWVRPWEVHAREPASCREPRALQPRALPSRLPSGAAALRGVNLLWAPRFHSTGGPRGKQQQGEPPAPAQLWKASSPPQPPGICTAPWSPSALLAW